MIKAVSIDDEINALGIIEQYIHESSGCNTSRVMLKLIWYFWIYKWPP